MQKDSSLEHIFLAVQELMIKKSRSVKPIDLSSGSLDLFKKSLFNLLKQKINNRRFSKCDIILYDEDTESDLLMLELSDKAGETNVIRNLEDGLQSVVNAGDYNRFKLLCHSKCLIDFNKFPKGSQKTLLHIACERGHLRIVKDLIEVHEMSPNIRYFDYKNGNTGMTPLHAAVLFDRKKIVKYLLKKGAKKSIKYLNVSAGKLIKVKRELRKLGGKKNVNLGELRKALKKYKDVRFMLNAKDLRKIFKRMGELHFHKKMKRKMKKANSSNELNDMLISRKFDVDEKKRKRIFDLKKMCKEISDEKDLLELENAELRKMLTSDIKTVDTEKVIEEIVENKKSDVKIDLGAKMKDIERGIAEMKKIAEKESLLRKKQTVQRRLKAANLSSDVKFLVKLLGDMEKTYPELDIHELEEFKTIEKKIVEHELRVKKINEQRAEKKLDQFDMFSVPPKKIEHTTEKHRVLEKNSSKGFDDIMITSVYAIQNAIENEKDENEMEEMLKEFCVL